MILIESVGKRIVETDGNLIWITEPVTLAELEFVHKVVTMYPELIASLKEGVE